MCGGEKALIRSPAMTEPSDTKRDYRDTVFLPKTDFPMKAGLPQKEPGILKRWQEEGLYERVREARNGREKFILHDGPPYANGDMHIGHALNHVLKDMVVRTQTLLGRDAPYVPGWDCHGLPIEWKVEEQYRKKKLNKDEVPPAEFRAECRAYAAHWVDVQRGQLKRLGALGDWENPYLTMDFEAEATIVSELMKFAESGQLYRGAKPVMWSPVEKTALAEAEVEYEDIVSTQIDVAFEIVESPIAELKGAYAVIWTTTPWTIPVNQALAYGPAIEYVLLSVTADTIGLGGSGDRRVNEVLTAAGYPFNVNRIAKFLVAKDLATSFADRLNKAAKALEFGGVDVSAIAVQEYIDPNSDFDASIAGSDLAGTKVRHPIYEYLRHSREGGNPGQDGAAAALDPRLRGDDDKRVDDEEWQRALEFYATPRPFLPGDFVNTDSGTGLVHMAPDHGEDDFELCGKHGIKPVFAVEGDGRYREDWAWLGGQGSVINSKFNAPDGPICSDLRDAGALLSASQDYRHSYPHSWRSKAKVIFRATPQWFVPMDEDSAGAAHAEPVEASGQTLRQAQGERSLRQTALNEIERVRFIPEKGRNRIRSMVEGRPDWVLSRQRAWGVPITLFVDRRTGEYLLDSEVNARILAAIRERGVDAWSGENAANLLGPDRNPDDYEMVRDILDVWFDSGCTHAFVLESGRWPGLRWPADLYLEGSDQHRGWFQSSLLQSCATRGRAPYDQVLTHGFTMAADGRKMSKSLGNTIDPLKVMEQYGADIIRLWALSVDYTEDHRIGDEILKGVGDQYRKLRNTFRYMLGALDGYDEQADRIAAADLPELERYVLGLLARLDGELRAAVDMYDFGRYTRLLVDFCNEDLSAFYFDIRKDSLYCDAPDDPKRNAYRQVLDTLFHALVRYAAPVLVFTAEEVWQTRYPDDDSVHLLEWPDAPAIDLQDQNWNSLRDLREQVMEAIEPLRRDKTIRSGLEADVAVPAKAVPPGLSDNDLAELFITASVVRTDSAAMRVTPSHDHKCGRCWRLLPEVAANGDLCGRCEKVVARMDAAP